MNRMYLGFVLLMLLCCYNTSAQTIEIKGTVVDTSAQVPLQNASIVLLQAKDSFIIADTRADKQGKFSFTNVFDSAGYVLLFTYPKYVDYSYSVTNSQVTDGTIDMGSVSLILKEKLLQEVIVKSATAAIRIKGDTTEYIADSFKVQPNASVEDLLKQLPGLQVDQYGNITAQGQKVKKVLVDGEEFFSDDPTLVTRNLRADMIDRVQVFDKKSDAAAFTGIDDGVRDKTINLKIKEDKNHGIFGKAELGGGTDKHYIGQGMLNAFKGKRKMSVYGTASNIGRVGLGSGDREKMGDDEGGSATYNGKGLPKAVSAGAHYSKKWNEDKESVNSNFKHSYISVEGKESTISQNNLPTGIIRSELNSNFQSRNENQKANAKYIHRFDTTSAITLYTDGARNHSKSYNSSQSQNLRGDNSLLYNNESDGNSDYTANTYNLNLSWEKKLKKYGRTLSFYFNNNFNNDQSDGTSRSVSRFYDEQNMPDSTATLHLRRKMNDNWRSNNLNINYTEPLTKKLSLLLNYKLGNEEINDDKRSYNLVTSPALSETDTSFSTKLNATEWSNQAGATLNYTHRKMIFKIGNNVKLVAMDIENIYQPLQLKRTFTNWNPSASFRYNPSQLKEFSIEYTGNSENPDRMQLLPYNYNNGQLTTYLSNTQLENSFTQTIYTRYFQLKNMGQTYFGGNLNVSLTSNPITLSSFVDPSGTYTYRYENLSNDNNRNYWTNIFYGRTIKGWNGQLVLGGNGGTMYSKINNALNKLNYNTYSLWSYLAKEKTKKYSVGLSLNGGYTLNKSSLQPDIRNNYFFFTAGPSTDIYFLKKLQFHTDANYFWQEKTQTFGENFDRLIWNAWLGYNMLKNDQLTIKVSCNDILNENNGYSRTANNTLFTENRYTTIRRFFMIGATWSFTKFNNIKQ